MLLDLWFLCYWVFSRVYVFWWFWRSFTATVLISSNFLDCTSLESSNEFQLFSLYFLFYLGILSVWLLWTIISRIICFSYYFWLHHSWTKHLLVALNVTTKATFFCFYRPDTPSHLEERAQARDAKEKQQLLRPFPVFFSCLRFFLSSVVSLFSFLQCSAPFSRHSAPAPGSSILTTTATLILVLHKRRISILHNRKPGTKSGREKKQVKWSSTDISLKSMPFETNNNEKNWRNWTRPTPKNSEKRKIKFDRWYQFHVSYFYVFLRT